MEVTETFKPSQVNLLGSFPPLCATMGKTEREIAASLIVYTCKVRGDMFAPCSIDEIVKILMRGVGEGVEPFKSMVCNPFCRPDYHDLCAAGYAVWSEDKTVIALTPVGLGAIRKWVQR